MGSAYADASTGVDCSGLTGLVYRSLGLLLPRNSGDQLRIGQPVELGALLRGDLVFYSTDGTTGGINHVMIFDEGDQLIESSSSGQAVVRRTSFSEKYGVSLQQLDGRTGRVSGQARLLGARVQQVQWTP